MIVCGCFLPNAKAASEVIAEGSNCAVTGNIGFQMEKGVFTLEVLSGTLNGTSAVYGLLYRGGNLYFFNEELCYVVLYQSADEQLGVTVEIAGEKQRFACQPSTEYNFTLPAQTQVYIMFSFAITMPHEENFMLYAGILGFALIIAGIFLIAYALRHYPIFTLSNKETVWDKDILPVAIACLIFGLGLLLAWLLQGAA